MVLQIIKDGQGRETGVFIPISFWKKLKKEYSGLGALESEDTSKKQLLQELKEAIAELKLIEQGKLKARSAKEVLDEL